METTMTEQDNTHGYSNWAKERMDEMNAALASLEATAHTLQAEAKVKGEQLIVGLKKHRDDFKALAKTQVEAQWNAFETQVKAYFDSVGKQVELRQATFRDIAAAQVKAWQEAADEFQISAGNMAAAKRADIDAAVQQMKADGVQAQARLQ